MLSIMPRKRFAVLYADPPWWYNKRSNSSSRFGLGIHGHYDPMKTLDICALPVRHCLQDNAVLFLWATCPRIPDALQVMSSWGFNYKTVAFVWVKWNRGQEGQSFVFRFGEFLKKLWWYGPGYYTGSNIELVFLGVKGSMPVTNRGVYQVYCGPTDPVHSRKPEEIVRRIETLYAPTPEHPELSDRLELFARGRRPGWDLFGNQVPGGQTFDLEELSSHG